VGINKVVLIVIAIPELFSCGFNHMDPLNLFYLFFLHFFKWNTFFYSCSLHIITVYSDCNDKKSKK